ncbi:MAG: UTP--glucose-1-phosphate uridylyltransferase GalU [Pseudomonadota bacterium]|jgi:UTP--glucose-1-phosphate uridylyltransferase|nr:UTP--glucose-1-phosphate uridylyltransferase GalU [Pseudomonadota bacterium]|tara:strand:- start:51 stop:929 length:879 start_codon:yes stop_codon:yes gene_type:complete
MVSKDNKVKKAVFPVAGLGTRFLPATKASPKEMLNVVDKPLIQYAAEEAVSAGIDTLIFVTGRNKVSIPNHFDRAYELESELLQKNKNSELELVQNILPSSVNCIYIRQKEALGLGHAVLCAEPAVGNDPFAVILADDLILSRQKSCICQMSDKFKQHEGSIISVQNVDKNNIHKYGVIDGEKINNSDWLLSKIVEKPKASEAPSNMGVVGRYIFNPLIFEYIRKTSKGSGGEIQLTDAIDLMLKKEKVYAYEFEGKRYDCGSKLGFLEATVDYGLNHPELSNDFKKYLDSI